VGCCERAVRVCWYEVVCCEWVVGSFGFSAYPAGYGGVSDLFGSLAVIALIVEAFRFGVLSVP